MSLPSFPSSPTASPAPAMSALAVPSSPTASARPSSRSERLLRDTLRKDDNLRSSAVRASSRSRSAGSDCGDEDDDFFQSAILSRCSSRRNSATSALGHGHPSSFYVPDKNEHASYSQLLRSSSYSGSSRSARSERKAPRRVPNPQEKLADPYHDPAPHEAVLRNRLDTVIHGTREVRIDMDTSSVEVLTYTQSSIASLPSSLGSLSNSRTQSNESDQTHITAPDVDSCLPSTPLPKRTSAKGHRQTQSLSVSRGQPTTSPRRPSSPPHVLQRAHQSPRSLPQTPRSPEKELLKRQHSDSPWMLTPLPPSPPAFSTSPSKRTGPTVATVVSTHHSHTAEPHAHLPTRSPGRHSRPSSFDPDAASHALRQLPGYVSFASVAGLGAPPEEEERRTARKPFVGFNLGSGKGRLATLGLGGGKWWVF